MVTAELKNYRQSPRKVRLVVDAVRGKQVNAALTTLTFMPKKASKAVKKLVESAIANASHNFNLNPETLFVKEITVDQGPILKRWRARARGRAASIHKHTSHIKVVLAEQEIAETKEDVKEDNK
jgi:large subunit ribosomal protein L22